MRKLRITANDTKSLATKYSQAHFTYGDTEWFTAYDESSMSVSRYVINCIDKNRTNIIHNGDVLISEVCTLNAQLQKLSNRKELPVKEIQNAISTAISKLNDLANEGI